MSLDVRSLALAMLALTACDPGTPAVPDAPTDGGVDAPALDTGTPDAGMACLGGSVCSVAPNAGCPGGQSCFHAHDGTMRTNECLAPGAGELGEACTANGDCGAALHCIGGFCVELCCPTAGAPSTCGTGTSCEAVTLNIPGGGTDPVGLCMCTVGGAACPADHYCDPLDDAGTQGVCLAQGTCSRLGQDCPSGQGCYGTVRECAPAGTAAVGAACTAHRDCVPGAWCRDDATGSVCSDYCDVGMSGACPAGFTCTSFGDDQPMVGGCYPL